MKVEVAVLNKPTVSVDVKQHNQISLCLQLFAKVDTYRNSFNVTDSPKIGAHLTYSGTLSVMSTNHAVSQSNPCDV